MAQALDGLIVEVNAIDSDGRRQGGRVNSEPVVLGGDFDPPGFKVFDRLIGAAMTNLSLKVLPPNAWPRI